MRKPASRWWLLAAFGFIPLALLIFAYDGSTHVARGKAGTFPLSEPVTQEQERAQERALRDPRVQAHTAGARTEVFEVHPASHQFNPATISCNENPCQQVSIYNFDSSETIVAIVQPESGEVLDVQVQPYVRPGIPQRLAERAIEIAVNAPEVAEVLGYRPDAVDWRPMDSTPVGTACQDGHVCVAPTFQDGRYLLWAIVDLTEEELVDLAWTTFNTEEDQSPTYPPRQGCDATPGEIALDGWSMAWETTAHDGFHLYNVAYHRIPVLTSAKIVEWHVDYGNYGFEDSTGCGPGTSMVYAYGDTEVRHLLDEDGERIGFELVQDFRQGPMWGNYCNYRYEQHYQFHIDGRFRVVGVAFGKGCEEDGIYRALMRLDVAPGTGTGNTLAAWQEGEWVEQEQEIRFEPGAETTPEGYAWRYVNDSGSGYYIMPGRGQFSDGGRGDNEFLYAIRFNTGEGEGDFGTFQVGCCDENEHGPEIFINEESIRGEDLVIWYIPQMQTEVNRDEGIFYCWTEGTAANPGPVHPCYVGPMFVPFTGTAPSQHLLHIPLVTR